jgi:hypothetical protein
MSAPIAVEATAGLIYPSGEHYADRLPCRFHEEEPQLIGDTTNGTRFMS